MVRRKREAAIRLPDAAVVETAGARRNRAATLSAMCGRQSMRGIRIRISLGGVRRGAEPD
jgi:hypothetical protein